MNFSKLLVQPPHQRVTCAHHKTFLIIFNNLRLLWYIHAVVEVLDEDSRVEGCFKNKKVFIEELSSAQNNTDCLTFEVFY